MKIKVIYIVSDVNKSLGLEWAAALIDKNKFSLKFVLLNPGRSIFEDYLVEQRIPVERIEINSRLGFFGAIMKLTSCLRKEKPDIIHCHLRKAELIGIPGAFITGIKRRIYTRHSSTYHHLYHPKGVIIDKFISALSTDVVAVSENVRTILVDWEHVKKEKVRVIHHGFDLDLFNNVSLNQVKAIKNKYKYEGDYKVIGVIARYTWFKGYAYSIPAIGRLMKDDPKVLLVIANASGNDKEEVQALIRKNIPSDRIREILFEPALPALYKTFDYFVHVPFDQTAEAFGQTYIEALASGVPSVFTLSGIAVDFIKNRKNALVVNYKSETEIYLALRELMENPTLRNEIARNGLIDIKSRFSVEMMINELQKLYAEVYKN